MPGPGGCLLRGVWPGGCLVEAPPPPGRLLLRAVRILLECILVVFFFQKCFFTTKYGPLYLRYNVKILKLRIRLTALFTKPTDFLPLAWNNLQRPFSHSQPKGFFRFTGIVPVEAGNCSAGGLVNRAVATWSRLQRTIPYTCEVLFSRTLDNRTGGSVEKNNSTPPSFDG